jgi:hypothetical protein
MRITSASLDAALAKGDLGASRLHQSSEKEGANKETSRVSPLRARLCGTAPELTELALSSPGLRRGSR